MFHLGFPPSAYPARRRTARVALNIIGSTPRSSAARPFGPGASVTKGRQWARIRSDVSTELFGAFLRWLLRRGMRAWRRVHHPPSHIVCASRRQHVVFLLCCHSSSLRQGPARHSVERNLGTLEDRVAPDRVLLAAIRSRRSHDCGARCHAGGLASRSRPRAGRPERQASG
jgi:hypothetical protein